MSSITYISREVLVDDVPIVKTVEERKDLEEKASGSADIILSFHRQTYSFGK